MQALSTAALTLLLAACGAPDEGPCAGSGGPDVSAIQDQLLGSINLEVDGAARIAEFREVGRDGEGKADFQSCQVRFQGEIEFTSDCYYHLQERRKGDRAPFEAEAEFLKDEAGWKRTTLGIYPR